MTNEDYKNTFYGTVLYGTLGVITSYLGWIVPTVIFAGFGILKAYPAIRELVIYKGKETK